MIPMCLILSLLEKTVPDTTEDTNTPMAIRHRGIYNVMVDHQGIEPWTP